MNKIYINGKFLCQRMTGVQRFANGVIKALDRNLQNLPCGSTFELLLPPSAEPIDCLKVITQRHVGPFNMPLSAWEQIVLPVHSLDGVLICLSGSAPLFVRNSISTIHDAAVFKHPYAYSRAFVCWYRLLFKYYARRSRLVFTVSKSSAQDLAEYISQINFRVIPNSAEHIIEAAPDLSVVKNLNLSSHGYLLAVGSLNKTKNFAGLINAYVNSTLVHQLPLVIVGGIGRVVFKSDSLVLDNPSVIWAGSVTDGQLRALYEHAALFIFPSLYEGFGIPPLEAMHCGCPVVASNASSIPEVCGDAAVYFDPRNGEAILNSIRLLLSDNLLRDAMVDLGKKQVNMYSWDNAAVRMLDALIEFGYLDNFSRGSKSSC
jgi:glycosyltransferase involved in cell wall biosynthesis